MGDLGSGMGRATALAFAEAGVRGLVFADIRDKAAAEVAEEAKVIASNSQFESFVIQVDMGDEDSVKNLMAKSVEKFGRIDYCANIAGVCFCRRLLQERLINVLHTVFRQREEAVC